MVSQLLILLAAAESGMSRWRSFARHYGFTPSLRQSSSRGRFRPSLVAAPLLSLQLHHWPALSQTQCFSGANPPFDVFKSRWRPGRLSRRLMAPSSELATPAHLRAASCWSLLLCVLDCVTYFLVQVTSTVFLFPC